MAVCILAPGARESGRPKAWASWEANELVLKSIITCFQPGLAFPLAVFLFLA